MRNFEAVNELVDVGQRHRVAGLHAADDFDPIKQMQLEKFDGTTWKVFGEVISGSGT